MKLPFWKGRVLKIAHSLFGLKRGAPQDNITSHHLLESDSITPYEAELFTHIRLKQLRFVFTALLISLPLDFLIQEFLSQYRWIPDQPQLEWTLFGAGVFCMCLALFHRPILKLLEVFNRLRRTTANYQQFWSLILALGVGGWLIVDMTVKAAQTSLSVAGVILLGALLLAPIWYRSIRKQIIQKSYESQYLEPTPMRVVLLHRQIFIATLGLMLISRIGHTLTLLACSLMQLNTPIFFLIPLAGAASLLMIAPDPSLFRTSCIRCTREVLRGAHPGEYCDWCASGLRQDSATEFIRQASHNRVGWTLLERLDRRLRDPFGSQ